MIGVHLCRGHMQAWPIWQHSQQRFTKESIMLNPLSVSTPIGLELALFFSDLEHNGTQKFTHNFPI